MNSINNFDNFLLWSSINLTCIGEKIFIDQPLGTHSGMIGDARPLYGEGAVAWVLNIPAAIVNTIGTISSVTSLVFKLTAKIALKVGEVLGNKQARQWSQEINFSSTVNKIKLFAIGLFLNVLGIVLFPFGLVSHYFYMNILEKSGKIEGEKLISEKIKAKLGEDLIELDVEDIKAIAATLLTESAVFPMCVTGFAGDFIQSAAKKNGYNVVEEHLDSAKYIPLKEIKYCRWRRELGALMGKDYRVSRDMGSFCENGQYPEMDVDGKSTYKWTLRRNG